MKRIIALTLSTVIVLNTIASSTVFANTTSPTEQTEKKMDLKPDTSESNLDDKTSDLTEVHIEDSTETSIEEPIVKDEQSTEIDENNGQLILDNEDNFDYVDNGDGTASITGYSGTNTDLVIPTSINGLEIVEFADEAFKGKKFTSVIVEGDIKRVGSKSFNGTILNSITFSGNVDLIESNAFMGAVIDSIVFKKDVGIFNNNALMWSHIKSLTVDGNIKEIGYQAFYGINSNSNSLVNVVFNGDIDKIGDYAFYSSNIDKITFHGDIPYLSSYMFSDINNDVTKGAELEFLGKMEYIGDYAISYSNLKSVVVESELSYIDEYAFTDINSYRGDNVTILFNNSIGTIKEYVFYDAKVKSILVNGYIDTIEQYTALDLVVDDFLLIGGIGTIGYGGFQSSEIRELLVKGDINTIEDYAFLNVHVLDKMVIEGNVGTIGASTFNSVDIPFMHIQGNINSIEREAFASNVGEKGIGSKEIIVDGKIGSTGKNSFVMLNSDKFIVKKGIENIGEESFQLSDIKELDIFTNTKALGDRAFQSTKFNTEVEIPSTVTSLGMGTFRGASAPNYIVNANYHTITDEMFNSAKVLRVLTINDMYTNIGNSAFKNVGIEEVKLSKNLESIGDEAFFNHKLSCVTTNSKLAAIGIDAFKSSEVAPEDFTIWGDKDSAAETYAQANGHIFKENDIFSNDCNPAEWAIEVEYVDEQGMLLDSKTISKPAKGNHTESAKAISGYTVKSNKIVTVEVTNENPNHTITFIYKKNASPKPPPETILGTVMVKYVDENEAVLDSKVVNNLPLGMHIEQAKQIAGYIVKGNQTATVEITNKNLEHTISFVYSKNTSPKPPETVLGTVEVKYVDENKVVLDSKVVNNLPLGTHIEHAKDITGYQVTGSKQLSVEITKDNDKFTITFTYKKVNEPVTPEPGPSQPEITLPPITTPSTTEPLPETPSEEAENHKGKRVIRDEGNGIYSTVPHFLDRNSKLKITSKYNYGLLITDRVSVPFKDIDGLFSYQEVEDLYNYLIVKGTTPSTYSPKKDLTRGEFSAMLARALELRTNSKKYKFKDVNVYKKRYKPCMKRVL
ncbi:S-layer domain-containing protein [Lysinibacillus capsici]|uniref:S-layer domain-containing protein n=1 Tax=Lysinibacillus capsici TaxID=2115968 RepID=A0A2X1BFS0_9BACI|nr:leucine-rich repeat protein [Lysinibacillus capsici]SPU40581.1 S-layer domain-containing protein [Lysinibacillus capsici]